MGKNTKRKRKRKESQNNPPHGQPDILWNPCPEPAVLTINDGLPGEFEFDENSVGDIFVRRTLKQYYIAGGCKTPFGEFCGTVIQKENGWLLLKYITIRFGDVVGREDHIWICEEPVYSMCETGNRIRFNAIVYAYYRNPEKHGVEDAYDFSLKGLENVRIEETDVRHPYY